MNIESINYRSIVNRYMHDDCTLIFAQIATLHLRVYDSGSLATALGTHIHNPNPLKWVLTILSPQKFLSKMSSALARSKQSNRIVTYNTIGTVRRSEGQAQVYSLQ